MLQSKRQKRLICLVDLVETTSKCGLALHSITLKFSPLRYASVEKTKGIDLSCRPCGDNFKKQETSRVPNASLLKAIEAPLAMESEDHASPCIILAR